jgi:hypothetical protein
MVVACIALSVALGGTSVAAIQALPRNSVGAKQLKRNAVTNVKIKANAVNGAKVANNSIRGADVLESSLAQVPSAASAASATTAGSATTATTASNALNLEGTPASGYFRYGTTIPSGRTVAGAWGIVDDSAAAGEFHFTYESFPLAAPVGLADADVNFKAGTPGALDGDAACTGTSAAPTAPAGKVCLYPSGLPNALITSLAGFQYDTAADSKFGFGVRAITSGAGTVVARGSWAYTAP